jgi:hypothetical protein
VHQPAVFCVPLRRKLAGLAFASISRKNPGDMADVYWLF